MSNFLRRRSHWITLIVTSTIMIGLPLYVYVYSKNKIHVDISSSLDIVLDEKWAMRDKVFLNNKYSLTFAFDSNENSFYDALRKKDRVIKYQGMPYYLIIRHNDTMQFNMVLEK